MKIRKIKGRFFITACCPGCGHTDELRYSDERSKGVDYIPSVLNLICAKCHTKFTITHDNGADEARRAFELAEDYDNPDLVIIGEDNG